MAKRKKDKLISITDTSSRELLERLNAVHSLKAIEAATGVDRGTISKLISGRLSRTNEYNYRAIVRFAIECGFTVVAE